MQKALVLALAIAATQITYADDLWQVYQQAAANDAAYQAAKATFLAAKEAVPIAQGALLPSLQLAGSSTWNDNVGSPSYNSNGYSLTLTQPIFNLASWKTYDQSEVNVEMAAVKYAQAEQALITSVEQGYFAILADQDNLRYSKANQSAQQQNLLQVEQRYKVGLAAMSDVQYARSQYEQAIASTVQAENQLADDQETLAVLTGAPVKNLVPLKIDFALFKPNPAKSEAWVNTGLNQNLALELAKLQVEVDKYGESIGEAGYLPVVNATAGNSYARTNTSTGGSTYDNAVGLNLTYNIYSGGTTVATVQQARYTTAQDKANADNQVRQTISAVRQDYLKVLSDISQIQAYQQAIVSGESALAATRAAYEVGTKTLVDLLTQQSSLYQNQQQYVAAIQNYINDSLTLKLDAGILSPNDLAMINHGLLQPAKVQASS